MSCPSDPNIQVQCARCGGDMKPHHVVAHVINHNTEMPTRTQQIAYRCVDTKCNVQVVLEIR